MLASHAKFRYLSRISIIQQRLQATAVSEEKSVEWEQAASYKQIPKVGLAHLMGHMLVPGGRYYKMEVPDMMLDLRNRNGSLYRLAGVSGKAEVLVTNDPSHFERVFRAEGTWPERSGNNLLHHHRNKLRKDFYQGTEGLISTQGEVWAKFRSAVNPVMMQPKTVRLYYQKMSNVNKEFIQRIRDIRDEHTSEMPDNFEEEINRWTLESVSVVALDKQLGLIKKNRNNPQAKKLFDSMTEFFHLAAEIDLKPSIWRFIPTPAFKRVMKALDYIQEVTVGYVNEALERLEREPSNKPESEQSVLEKLLKIDKKVATVMAMDMLMAGVDTTSSTFTGCLLALAKNPEKQAKLREEILKILPEKDSEFTEESMKNVPYLRACIKEALRVYPLTFGNGRVIKSDIVLEGYQIPKGTSVILLFNGLQKDEYYPKCNEFLPERWLRPTKEDSKDAQCPNAESLKISNPFVYLPFGFGPRMCIGRRIADMELELGIARLVRNFHIEFNHPMEKPFRNEIIYIPNMPLKFKFTDVEN